jgi:1,4-dihydroxy-2-naphthoate octaprenyltransferase
MTGLASFTSPLALIAVLAAPVILGPVHAIVGGHQGRALIPVLVGTGLFQLAWSALLGLGLALGLHVG